MPGAIIKTNLWTWGAQLAFGAADRTKSVTGLSVAVAAGSMLAYYATVTGTPAGSYITLGLCGYNAPSEPTPGWNRIQYLTEPPTAGAFNKIAYESEPPVSSAWNKVKYG